MTKIFVLTWQFTCLRWLLYGAIAVVIELITFSLTILASGTSAAIDPIPGFFIQVIGGAVIGAILGGPVRTSCVISRASVFAAVLVQLVVFSAFPAYLVAGGVLHDSPTLFGVFATFGTVGFGLGLLDLHRYRSALRRSAPDAVGPDQPSERPVVTRSDRATKSKAAG